MNKIRGFRIRLRKREILKNLKFNSNLSEIKTETEQLIQNQIEVAYLHIYPSVIYETYSRTFEDFNSIKESILIGSNRIKELLKDSFAFTLMAATIGEELEKKIDNIKEDLVSASVLDAIGSEAAEQCANFVSKIIRNEAARQECYLGIRFSPGYGDWPLEASKKISALLDINKIDIKITASGIMVPRKSITAIQAWIPE